MRKRMRKWPGRLWGKENNQGMTMVEVLMGFVLLAIVLGMFSKIIVTSSNMYYNSVDLKRAQEAVQKETYASSVTDGLTPLSGQLKLYPEGADKIAINAIVMKHTKLYQISSATDMTDADAKAMDVTVYIMKADKKTSDDENP